MRALATLIILLTLAPPATAFARGRPHRGPRVRAVAEVGVLGVASHHLQLSHDGTDLDLVAQAGQDNLFPVARMSAEVTFGGRHTVVLLYQPLDLRTSALLASDVRIDGADFLAGTALDTHYGFDFWRASYLYDLAGGEDADDADQLAIGGSLQIRDAAIEFTSGDGALRRVSHDIGPVPLLKLRARHRCEGGFWLGLEADGIYAPVKYFNGGRSDVVGALLDASLSAGLRVRPGLDVFVALRYLGGGATGTSKSHTGPGDGYVSNWLHFITLTVGVELGPGARRR